MRLIRQSDFGRLLGYLFVARVMSGARAQVDIAIKRRRRNRRRCRVYDQPPIPEPGYLWVPGYWAWDDDTGYLGARHLGLAAGTSVVVDARILGLERRRLRVSRRIKRGPQIGFYGGVAYGLSC